MASGEGVHVLEEDLSLCESGTRRLRRGAGEGGLRREVAWSSGLEQWLQSLQRLLMLLRLQILLRLQRLLRLPNRLLRLLEMLRLLSVLSLVRLQKLLRLLSALSLLRLQKLQRRWDLVVALVEHGSWEDCLTRRLLRRLGD
jgi:hypothetical protein